MGEDEDFEAPESPSPPSSPASGELRADAVFVADAGEASTLRNKGFFGVTVGQSLRLSPLETCYLAEGGRLVVHRRGEPVTFKDLLRWADRHQPGFEVRYVVFRDLRQRGYVVEEGSSPIDFHVHPRGGGPGRTPTKTWISAVSERSPFVLADVLALLERVLAVRKSLLLGVVDEESDLTYYAARVIEPKGTVASLGAPAEAHLLADRAVVLDTAEAEALSKAGHFGKIGGKRLQLSLLETAYLMEKKMLRVQSARQERRVPLAEVLRRARRVQEDFDLRLRVYRDLRTRGILVKTGFKYGTHFRAYEGDPDRSHAKFLIHSLPSDYRGGWPEVSRAVRLAHGVRKQLLLAACGREIAYVHLERVRP